MAIKSGIFKDRAVWPIFAARVGLALVMILATSWCLAGSLSLPSRIWRENQVAPYTVYAPFLFTYQDLDRVVEVQRGELLVSKGERLTPVHVARLNTVEQTHRETQAPFHWVGALLIAILFTLVVGVYLQRYEKKIWQNLPQQVLIVTVGALILGVARLMIDSPIDNAWIPVATIPMLLGMLLNPQVGIVLGLLGTGLVAMMAQADLPLLIGLSMGCFVSAYAVRGIRRRIHFFLAGLIVGGTQAVAIFASYLLMQWPVGAALPHTIAGFFNGLILCSVVTYCLLPLLESLFGLITPVTLLEFSDLNHPLLKELSVKAPGTYHHSLIVANLAEAACEEIGANALLARVGCYFHDIGKMLHPEYFVENQPPEISRHDHISPSMSSLVILNHVKDGIKLARKHRINQAIIDFIPGHHGTGLIYYFYRRALEEIEDENLLKEERFRYPGPKPQTRETAVVLMSDSVEAATRALPDKSPAKMQEVVRRIINNKFIDGQLDDCELTLKNLHRIAEAFLRVLAGIYHSRVEYPKAPGEEMESAAI